MPRHLIIGPEHTLIVEDTLSVLAGNYLSVQGIMLHLIDRKGCAKAAQANWIQVYQRACSKDPSIIIARQIMFRLTHAGRISGNPGGRRSRGYHWEWHEVMAAHYQKADADTGQNSLQQSPQAAGHSASVQLQLQCHH